MPETVGVPIEDGFYCLNAEWRFTFLNRITLGFLKKKPEDLVGKVVWDEFPTLVGSTFEKVCHSVAEKHFAQRIEIKSSKSGVYYHIVVFPASGGVAVYWRDITAEKHAEETLVTLVEKLKLADENRNAFINTLSHELRNPLAAISLGLTLMKEAPPESEQAEKALNIMERQTSQLSSLVDELLDVTRITQNKVELKKERIDLNKIVYHIVTDIQPLFAEKGVRLDIELSSEPIYLDADPARLTQAIGNLIHNAAKFTNKGDKTIVSVAIDEEKPNQAMIIVQDTGIGIEPSLLPRLFEPFVQADSSLAHSYGGLGLGLPIVKGIALLHKGSVSVMSDGIGKGTKALICLPLPDEAAAAVDVNGADGNKEKTHPLEILIVEDLADLAEIMSELLSHLGHNVTVALDGPDGISLARHHCPDVLISDIGLPGMSGYEIAEVFRNDEKLKNVYLIALSGYAQPEDIARSHKAGFRHHLAKPVNLEGLKAALLAAERMKFGLEKS